MILKNLHYLLAAVCCFGVLTLWSQSSIKTAQSNLEKGQHKLAAQQFDEIRNSTEQSGNISLNITSSKNLADALLYLDEIDSAYHIINNTIPLAESIGDTLSLIDLLNWKSEYLAMMGKHEERKNLFSPIERHLEQYTGGHEKLYAETFAAYGNLLFATDRKKAIAYLNKSLELCHKTNDSPKIAYINNLLAVNYLRQYELSNSIIAGIEASKYTVNNSPTFQAAVYQTIGQCLVKIGNYKRAIYYLDLAEEHASSQHLKRFVAKVNKAKAELYFDSKEDSLFNVHYSKALEIWDESYGLDLIANCKSLRLRYLIRNNEKPLKN